MKRQIDRFALWLTLFSLGIFLSACAQLTEAGFKGKALAAQSSITQLQISTRTLLDAKKISSADAENVLKVADAATAGIAVARQYNATDPKAGEAKLQAVIAILTAAQAGLAATTGGK